MADNTRVNELQDKLLQAMDILNAQALNSISFDKTITCTIENDENKKDGKYEVSDGSIIFTAYSIDERYRNGDVVYVIIPQGDYENQKMIIGKKTSETEEPFNFVTPFDSFFSMTGNLAVAAQSGSLIANDIEDNTKPIEECMTYIPLLGKNGLDTSKMDLINYTRLGIKANFKSWIKNAVKGNYGLEIVLFTEKQGTVSEEKEIATYTYNLDSSNMYGNPYNFETYYNQELVLDIGSEDIGKVTNIKVNFYQAANFYDQFNEPIPSSLSGFKTEANTNRYVYYPIDNEQGETIENSGYYIPLGDKLNSNLFINNLEIHFGYDISMFTNDYVEIYTQDRSSYKCSTSTETDNSDVNKKEINMRWVHIIDGKPVDMVIAADKATDEEKAKYEVCWYRYHIGAAAADPYCGIYWERMYVDENNFLRQQNEEDKNTEIPFGNIRQFTGLRFDPDVNKQQEKIKAIVIYEKNTPYRSNELIFENEEDLPPSEEAQHIISALTITTDDDTNGNYMIYGQDNSIKDTEYGKIQRSMSVWFDANNDGELSENEKIIDENQASNITWTFPAQNTMIDVVDPNKVAIKENEGTEDEKIIAYQIHTCSPQYKIASYYTPNKSNNTITCEYCLNGRVYTTEKEFTFGPAGTMGTDQTLVIDFVGDVNAVNKADEADNNINIEIQLYDNQNIAQEIPDGGVQWAWYYNSNLDNGTIKFPFVIEGKTNKQITFTKDQFDIDSLYILQATVGDLTTYFPIPIQSGGYSFIKGPTQVIYQADGEPAYSREAYALYSGNMDTLTKSWVKICKTTDENKLRYTGTIDKKTHKLKPLSIYVKDAPIYGVQAKSGTTTLWTQPILVLQNQWPNGVINKWDGKSLVLDEANSTILAAALSAGKKNDDNTFSGVMIGDWSNQDVEASITEETGLYGFHHGAMSYAFKEDGTAFIGKDGRGRIHINGNDATIYSETYNSKNHGIKIDLNDPYIVLSNNYNQDTIANSSTNTYPFQIGSKFKVKWDGTIYATNGEFSGHINAYTGTIGSWEIVDGKLQSDDEKIVLSTEGTGTILINEDDIIIKGAYQGEPTQITLSNNSVIHGGIIEAGTLRSNTTNSKITLDGYLTVLDSESSNASTKTFLGFVKSNTGDWVTDYFSDGVGMGYGTSNNPNSILKATSTNVGLCFKNGGWISIGSTGISMGGNQIDLSGIDASDQKGIYARFA